MDSGGFIDKVINEELRGLRDAESFPIHVATSNRFPVVDVSFHFFLLSEKYLCQLFN